MVLGLADPMRDEALLRSYTAWIERMVADLEIRILSCTRQNRRDLDECEGLILTGGGDIHPAFYKRNDALGVVKEVSEERDRFEFALIDRALQRDLPILGICRGAQVFNVALGGTLIPDIEDAGFSSHRGGEAVEHSHRLTVKNGTLLHEVAGVAAGIVNTYHHQAVDRPGDGLRISGWSDDGVTEALEWEKPDHRPFLLLVQWHPERMMDDSLFSRNIIERLARALHKTKTSP